MYKDSFKAAFVTNDGVTISQHYGPSKLYKIIEVQEGKVVDEKIIDKPNFHQGGGHNHNSQGGHSHGENHSHGGGDCGPGSTQDKHTSMLSVIEDCDYMLVGGMGNGMYSHLAATGITPIMTDEHLIQHALEKLINKQIVSRNELVH